MQPLVLNNFVFQVRVQGRRRQGQGFVARVNVVDRVSFRIVATPMRTAERSVRRDRDGEVGIVVFARANRERFSMDSLDPNLGWNQRYASNRQKILLRAIVQLDDN